MVTKTIEFYAIRKMYEPGDDECFDTFEQAVSHILDKDEKSPNHFKYEAYWNGSLRQECIIYKYRLDPTTKTLKRVEMWEFEDGVQKSHIMIYGTK